VILIRHGQTEFNRVFSTTRRDLGIRDPHLTDQGRRQVQAVARVSGSFNLARLITSPYARALETAAIIAEHLSVPITVDPLIAERFSFTCDIGSPLTELRAGCPDLAFDHLPDPWWPIRALTGLKVPNGAVLWIEPTQPDREPELLFVPGAD
jgi:broad specificity phosphatase PhoE